MPGSALIFSQRQSTNSGACPPPGLLMSISPSCPVKRSAYHFCFCPRYLPLQAWSGKYRGQKQKWYALRFTGQDGEIDINSPGGGHAPEFVDWRWEKMSALPGIVVAFKRSTYERVVKEFAKFARS